MQGRPSKILRSFPTMSPTRFYRELIEAFKDWQRDDRAVLDPHERERFRALIEREARLLDQLDFDAWLSMYAPECIYWVPATPGGGDPRREVAISFDDRRRMKDRIYRLRTGYAWSQAPVSRTVRIISNVEVFAAAFASKRMVRSNFLISEFRPDGARFLSGLVRAPLCRAEWAVGDRGAPSQSDRLRSESAQPKYHSVMLTVGGSGPQTPCLAQGRDASTWTQSQSLRTKARIHHGQAR